MFNLIPKEVRFFDYFEQQSQQIIKAGTLLSELVHNFADARAKAFAIKEVEHAGDQITHEMFRHLNTTFITPIDREDIHDLATRLDDVLDFIEAVAERLVIYRIKEPTSACRALAELIVAQIAAMFEAAGDPIEVIKWKEIYETLEAVTDRCEDVANVIEGIILKMA